MQAYQKGLDKKYIIYPITALVSAQIFKRTLAFHAQNQNVLSATFFGQKVPERFRQILTLFLAKKERNIHVKQFKQPLPPVCWRVV